MIRAVPQIAAMAPYALTDLPAGLVSLSQNESLAPPSPSALEAGRQALAGAALYPDPNWTELRRAIADTHGLDPAMILCGAGSMELIGALVHAFVGPADAVLGSQYGYLYLATACQQTGARHDTAPEQDYAVSVEAMMAAVRPDTRIVFVCNPGNPTGTRVPNADLVRLRAGLPEDVLLIIDQAYAEFDPQDPQPVFDLVVRGNTVVTRTFSKAYGLASARVGWGVFPPAIAAEVRKVLNPNNVSGVSQAMAAAAMRDQTHMRGLVATTASRRQDFVGKLRAAVIDPPDSYTNFVLIPFADAGAAGTADRALRAKGILLRGMGGYGLGHCLRATIGAADVMDRAAAVLATLRDQET